MRLIHTSNTHVNAFIQNGWQPNITVSLKSCKLDNMRQALPYLGVSVSQRDKILLLLKAHEGSQDGSYSILFKRIFALREPVLSTEVLKRKRDQIYVLADRVNPTYLCSLSLDFKSSGIASSLEMNFEASFLLLPIIESPPPDAFLYARGW